MVIFTSIINLYDNILITKYQGLITWNRLTPLHISPPLRCIEAMQQGRLKDRLAPRSIGMGGCPFPPYTVPGLTPEARHKSLAHIHVKQAIMTLLLLVKEMFILSN